jgi:hypothetical protein
MKVLTQVLDTLIGQGVVKPEPVVLFTDVSTRAQRLHKLGGMDVRDLKSAVLSAAIFLAHEDTLLEKLVVDGKSVLLRDQHYVCE